MYTLEEVFDQANADNYAAVLNGVGYTSRTLMGIKIVRDDITKQVQLMEGFFTELESKEIEPFLERGWRYGVYIASLRNHRIKMDLIDRGIRNEMNSSRSDKRLDELRALKAESLKNYTAINSKLDKLNNDNNKNN